MIRRTAWFRPYLADGSPALRKARPRPGVYAIRKGRRVVYVGHSGSDVRRVMHRHFQQWGDRHYHATYDKADRSVSVVVLYGMGAKAAQAIERRLIARYNPPDNIFKYGGAPPPASTPDVDLYGGPADDLPF